MNFQEVFKTDLFTSRMLLGWIFRLYLFGYASYFLLSSEKLNFCCGIYGTQDMFCSFCSTSRNAPTRLGLGASESKFGSGVAHFCFESLPVNAAGQLLNWWFSGSRSLRSFAKFISKHVRKAEKAKRDGGLEDYCPRKVNLCFSVDGSPNHKVCVFIGLRPPCRM